VLEEEEPLVNIHIVDFHGEATGEKLSFAYSMDGRVSAVLGTHTHVQTRDYQILPNGTAFISDVGMCGDASGVLGFNKDSVVSKLMYGADSKFTLDDEGKGLFSAVVVNIDDYSGKAKEIFPIYYVEGENDER
jgi:calcineurin-like phosphoesterase